MKSPPRALAAIGFLLLFTGYSASAEIICDKGSKKIWIVDYGRDSPCTLEKMRQAVSDYGWDIVAYDAAKDMTRIAADIEIGTDAGIVGTDSVLQIGTEKHPSETLIIAGNIRIKLPQHGYVSRLQLGYPDKPGITPTVKFDCGKNGEHGMFVDRKLGRTLGSINVYHSTITALTQDKEHMVHSPQLRGKSEIINSDLSWIAGCMTYGIDLGRGARMAGSTLSHGGSGLYSCRGKVNGCTFTSLENAVADGGSLDVKLHNCVLKDNGRNASLSYGGRLVLTDCDIRRAKYPDVVRDHTDKNGTSRQSIITVKRSLLIKVVDSDGEPVEEALVDVANENDKGPPPENGASATDEDGFTPEKGSGREILLIESIRKADGGKDYTYKVRVAADGKVKEIPGLDPGNSWYGREIDLKVVMD